MPVRDLLLECGSPRCEQNCQQMAVKEYVRVVKDLARILCRNLVNAMQIKGLEGQILPLEPFCKLL